MKRNDFKKIIKIRSQWQFTGDNYKLPSGEPISVYVRKLVESQMNVDSLAIEKWGFVFCDRRKVERHNKSV